MLSDEEKEAIEQFKNFIFTYQDVIEDEYSDYEEKECAKEYQEVSEKILNLIEKQSKEIEKLKDKNSKLLEQNKDMKSLFNIQASIAKELNFNTNEKMVKFKDEYYVPDTMAINANIGEPKTIELRYISATKYLTKFDEEE